MEQFSLNAISTIIGQLTYFYTDKVGLAAGAIATVLLISKIIDAFTDLIMGNIVDHTKPGREKYRPWLLKAGIPAGIMLVLMFTVPKTSGTLQIAYALITNILLSAVLYTAVAIPYGSLMAVRTNSQEERGIMGTWRAGAGYVAGFIMAILIVPITNALGGTQSAWIKFGVIIGLFIILAFGIAYLTSRETATESGTVVEKVEEEEEAIPFREAITKLLHNNFTAYMVLGCFTTFATIPMMCLVGVMTTMAIDFNEYKYGVKMVACSNSASSFGGKVGSGVGGSLIGWMLAAVGYDATLSVAPEATKMAIYGFSFIIPLIAFVVMYVLVSRFDLEKKLPQMREEVAKRKQEAVK